MSDSGHSAESEDVQEAPRKKREARRRFFERVSRLFNTLFDFFDVAIFTPLRNVQKFGEQVFTRHIAGKAFSYYDFIFILPVIIKVCLNKDRASSVSFLTDKLKKDSEREKYQAKLDQRLQEMGKFDLKAKIQLIKNWRGKEKFVLRFTHADALTKAFKKQQWAGYQNKTFADLVEVFCGEGCVGIESLPEDSTQISVYLENLSTKLKEIQLEEAQLKETQLEDARLKKARLKELQLLENQKSAILKIQTFAEFFKFPEKEKLGRWEGFKKWLLKEPAKAYTYRTKLSLAAAIKEAQKLSPADHFRRLGVAAYQFAMQASFIFWIGFFSASLKWGGPNTPMADYMGNFPSLAKILVIGLTALVSVVLAAVTYIAYRLKAKHIQEKEMIFEDDVLAHELTRNLYLDLQLESSTEAIKRPDGIAKANLSDILSLGRESESELEGKLGKQMSLLQEEANIPEKFWSKDGFRYWRSRFITPFFNVVGSGVNMTFIPWWLGCVMVVLQVLAVTAVFASNPFAIGTVIFGALIGVLVTWKQIRDRKREMTTLKQDLDENKKADLRSLNRLIIQNKALEKKFIQEVLQSLDSNPKIKTALLERFGTKALDRLVSNAAANETLPEKNLEKIKAVLIQQNVMKALIDPMDDRAFRRLKLSQSTGWTWAQKAGNRFFAFLSKAGAGALFTRTVIFGFTVAIAMTGPAGIGIAVGVSVVWAILGVCEYHRKSKVAQAARTLEQLPERLTAARIQQAWLRQGLMDESLGADQDIPEPIRKAFVLPVSSPTVIASAEEARGVNGNNVNGVENSAGRASTVFAPQSQVEESPSSMSVMQAEKSSSSRSVTEQKAEHQF